MRVVQQMRMTRNIHRPLLEALSRYILESRNDGTIFNIFCNSLEIGHFINHFLFFTGKALLVDDAAGTPIYEFANATISSSSFSRDPQRKNLESGKSVSTGFIDVYPNGKTYDDPKIDRAQIWPDLSHLFVNKMCAILCLP